MSDIYVTDESTGERKKIYELSREIRYDTDIQASTIFGPTYYSNKSSSLDQLIDQIKILHDLNFKIKKISVTPISKLESVG